MLQQIYRLKNIDFLVPEKDSCPQFSKIYFVSLAIFKVCHSLLANGSGHCVLGGSQRQGSSQSNPWLQELAKALPSDGEGS